MAEVVVRVGGRAYPLSCRAGEEAHLTELARVLDAKAAEVGGALGATGEARLLLMAGLLVADDLLGARAGGPPPVDLDRLAALAARAEALAAALEAAA